MASFNTLLDDLKKSLHSLKNHPLLGTTTSSTQTTDTQHLASQIRLRVLTLLHQTGIADFVQNPRFDDPAYITSLVIALAAAFLTMSWFSRGSGGWGGRFSPFGRPGASSNNGEVSDADFSYITSEDLAHATKDKNRHRASSRATGPEIVDWEDRDPERETDVLIFKHGRTNYPAHFPSQCIQDGLLSIGTVRQTAAKKIGVSDARRIRMFFKGRNLKHDERTAREEGLRGEGTGSEILCVVGEASSGGMAPGFEEAGVQRAWSEGEDEDDDTEGADDSGTNTTGKKKSRKRGGKKNKKKPSSTPSASGTSMPGYSNADAAGPEYLPIPTYVQSPRPTSSSKPTPVATPQTPLGKLDALASKFHAEFVPLAVQFMASPPEDAAKRSMEYKKLSETILTQVLMKLDSVETDGDQEARSRRKELVKEVQGLLNKLDEVVK